MSHLSHRAEELVRAGRDAGRSMDDDRERILSALHGRLGDGILLNGISAARPRPRARITRPVWTAAAAVAVGLAAGAALALTLRGGPPSVSPSNRIAASQLVVEATPPAPQATAGVATTASESPPPSAPAAAEPASVTARDRLAQEVAILSRAAKYLEAGRALDALRTLDEHQKRFPKGILTEERYSARVQALCALGRRGEAAAEIARLSRIAPDSPHLARARQACATASAPSAD